MNIKTVSVIGGTCPEVTRTHLRGDRDANRPALIYCPHLVVSALMPYNLTEHCCLISQTVSQGGKEKERDDAAAEW
ncbi:hypothetical protein GCM10009525_82310 [Streptosporangium amethystogenes subsp. fukuiense]